MVTFSNHQLLTNSVFGLFEARGSKKLVNVSIGENE